MAYYTTPLGGVIMYPDIADHAFLCVSPLTFVQKLIAANPRLSVRFLTTENIKFTFMGMLAFKQLRFSPLPKIRPKFEETLQRWKSSSEWGILRFLLDGDVDGAFTQSPVPGYSDGSLSNTLSWGAKKFLLPNGPKELLTVENFDIRDFIQAFKASNPSQQNYLSAEVVKVALEKFAAIRSQSAVPGFLGRFMAQLETPYGARALNDHSWWLMRITQPDSLPPAYEPPYVLEPSNKLPEIHFMGLPRRTHILLRRCSLHILLAPDDPNTIPPMPKRTHLHYMRNPDGSTDHQKLSIVPSYNRAIVLEFDSLEQRDYGYKQIGSQKFSFGPRVMKAQIDVFQEKQRTSGTVWTFYRDKKYSAHSVHEALRRFFCLGGAVPSKFIHRDQLHLLGNAQLRLEKGLPVWMDKLVVEARECASGPFEVRVAEKCEFCKLFNNPAPGQKPSAGFNKDLRRCPDSVVDKVHQPRLIDSSYGRLQPQVEPAQVESNVKDWSAKGQNMENPNGSQNILMHKELQSNRVYRSPFERLRDQLEPLTLPIEVAKRKADAEQEPNDEKVQPKRQKTDGNFSGAVVVKTEEFSEEGEPSLDSLHKHLEELRNRRRALLLLKARLNL